MMYLAKQSFTTKKGIKLLVTCFNDYITLESNKGIGRYKTHDIRKMLDLHMPIFGPKIGKEFKTFIETAYTPKQLDLF